MKKIMLLGFFLMVISLACIVVIIGSMGGQPETDRIAEATMIQDISPDDSMEMQQISFKTEIIELTNDVGQNYFVNYRIKREQFRQESKEMLRLLLESDVRSTKEQAQILWLELSHKIAKEGEIENVLKMRGFKDVVSEVNHEKIRITILAEELKYQEVNLIKTVTKDITGLKEDRIEVISRA